MRVIDGRTRAVASLAARDATERTAALASTGSIGGTFGPGLLPRSAIDQAVITGVVAAVNYGFVTADRLVAEQVAQARDAVARQLRSWGMSGATSDLPLNATTV